MSIIKWVKQSNIAPTPHVCLVNPAMIVSTFCQIHIKLFDKKRKYHLSSRVSLLDLLPLDENHPNFAPWSSLSHQLSRWNDYFSGLWIPLWLVNWSFVRKSNVSRTQFDWFPGLPFSNWLKLWRTVTNQQLWQTDDLGQANQVTLKSQE